MSSMLQHPGGSPHAVFVKTAAGHAALTERTALLNGRQRSLLIVINGKRDYAALQGIVPELALAPALGALRELGLITLIAGEATPTEAPAIQAAAPDALRFEAVKHMMTESAERFLGPMAGALARRISAANDDKQLRAAMGHWHMALRESKYGREHVDELLLRVSALLETAAA